MTQHLTLTITPAATELRLDGPGGPLPFSLWAVEAPPAMIPAIDLVHRLIAIDGAVSGDSAVLVEHATIAGLSAHEAALLALPPVTEAVAVVESSGLIARPSFKVELRWQRPNGQPLPSARRIGAWLEVGGQQHRLVEPLYSIAEAVDRLAGLAPEDQATRLPALAALTELLPLGATSDRVESQGLVGRIRIAVADAFSLDLEGEGAEAKLIPVLYRAGTDGSEGEPPLLLDRPQQDRFGRTEFHRFGQANPIYTLGSEFYLVLAPPLRRALDVVREVQTRSISAKRQLMASPRAYLRAALGVETDETVLEKIFVETRAYADRVIGLGLWQPRVVPWVPMGGNDWFGPELGEDGARVPLAGITVGDRTIPLDRQQAEDLRQRIEDAIARSESSVLVIDSEELETAVPATTQTLAAIQAVIDRATAQPSSDRPKPEPVEHQALLIEPNEEAVEAGRDFTRRSVPLHSSARSLATPPKPHQRDGIDWLQRCWRSGRPGVLLADDMGLGKTLQGLAFLAWLREGMSDGFVPRAPMLVVAPTGLLDNWLAEHDRHLRPPGLGHCLKAYGRDLAVLREPGPDGRPALRTSALAAADWVLTTYETLRDHDRDFGAVRFAVMLMDEAQKVKTPGIRLTDAAKAMNIDFAIAMTGTPVENRLADLWCIVDTVHPGCLSDLRSFSAEYEKEPDREKLAGLKRQLDRPTHHTPGLMLRRLKEDQLPDLQTANVVTGERAMPEVQLRAYEAALALARSAGRKGAVLEALQRLRAVSLHPAPTEGDDAALIAGAARLQLAIEALDAIRAAREAALVFVDDLDLQARLAGLFQRRWRLDSPPDLINGRVDGHKRQSRVDRFQGGEGFGVMLLSPRAGGVGLTLTRANHVIHLSRWWNPAVEDQCNGRAHRIGQTRPVTIHLPMAVLSGGRSSFDQNLHTLLERKRTLTRDVLMPPTADDHDLENLLDETVRAA